MPRQLFFEVGNCVRRHPETTKKVLAAGHTIGNHSLSHEFHRYFMPHFLDREVKTNQQILTEVIGRTPALYRSPWLWRTPFLLRALRQNGLTPISGEFCHSQEFMRIDPERTAQGALKKARPGAIIIFHDGKEGVGGNRSETAQAVAIVVKELHNQGYKFVTIDELLGIPAYQ